MAKIGENRITFLLAKCNELIEDADFERNQLFGPKLQSSNILSFFNKALDYLESKREDRTQFEIVQQVNYFIHPQCKIYLLNLLRPNEKTSIIIACIIEKMCLFHSKEEEITKILRKKEKYDSFKSKTSNMQSKIYKSRIEIEQLKENIESHCLEKWRNDLQEKKSNSGAQIRQLQTLEENLRELEEENKDLKEKPQELFNQFLKKKHEAEAVRVKTEYLEELRKDILKYEDLFKEVDTNEERCKFYQDLLEGLREQNSVLESTYNTTVDVSKILKNFFSLEKNLKKLQKEESEAMEHLSALNKKVIAGNAEINHLKKSVCTLKKRISKQGDNNSDNLDEDICNLIEKYKILSSRIVELQNKKP